MAESLVQPVDRPFEQAAVVGEEPVTVEVEPVDRHQGLDDLVVMVELPGTVADVEAGTEGQTRHEAGSVPHAAGELIDACVPAVPNGFGIDGRVADDAEEQPTEGATDE